MLFKKRNDTTMGERLRLAMWPRRSWARSSEYYVKRVLRLSATPYSIAMGTACGAFVSMTPLIGFHFILAFVLAGLLRCNLVAAGIGTFVGNPFTFPIIWVSTYRAGRFMLHGEVDATHGAIQQALRHHTLTELWPVMKPMLAGSLPIGLIAGAVVYLLTYNAVAAYQLARRERFAARHEREQLGGGREAA